MIMNTNDYMTDEERIKYMLDTIYSITDTESYFLTLEKIIDISEKSRNPDGFLSKYTSKLKSTYNYDISTIIENLKATETNPSLTKKFPYFETMGENFLCADTILMNLALGKLDYKIYIDNNFLADDPTAHFSDKFSEFCHTVLDLYIEALEKILLYDFDENAITNEFFDIDKNTIEEKPIETNLPVDDTPTEDEKFITNFLTSISKLADTVKDDTKFKNNQKLIIGSFLENILYTYDRFTDINSVYNAFQTLKILCSKYKRYADTINDIEASLNIYVSDKKIKESFENAISQYKN